MRAMMKSPVIIDGRNLFDPARMHGHGFSYFSIGRPSVRQQQAAAR
jgi:UDPglucose 6-dehydrogenase